MAFMRLNGWLNGSLIPVNQLQFSVTETNGVYNWGSSNLIEVSDGTYYYAIRRISDNAIIANGSEIVSTPSESTFEGVFTAESIEILQTQHQKIKVKSVLITDSNGYILPNNPRIGQIEGLDKENVYITLDGIQTVKVRIS